VNRIANQPVHQTGRAARLWFFPPFDVSWFFVIIQHKLFSSNPIKFLTGFSLNFFRIQPVSDSAQSTALFAPSELFWQHRNTGAYPRV
jgi:hypothetical protein